MAKKRWGNWENSEEPCKEGGQGRIFFVTDLTGKYSGVYALKELKNPKRLDRFEREVEAIIKIGKNPYVIDIIDSGIYTEGTTRPYYVMDRAESDLAAWLSQNQRQYEPIFKIFERLCLGVIEIHSFNIIHRDLKPENILLFSGQPKISDLGICLICEMGRLTQTSEAVGPRFYMAPELEDGQNLEVKFNADIYSLGKILYFLLSNGSVFSREKWRDRNFYLPEILNDRRFKIFDNLFRGSISADADVRIKNGFEFLEKFKKCWSDFNDHPRTQLLNKFSDLDKILNDASYDFENNFTSSEADEILVYAEDKRIPISDISLCQISKIISSASVTQFLKNMNSYKDLPGNYQKEIAVNLTRNEEFIKNLCRSSERKNVDAVLDRASEISDPAVLKILAEVGSYALTRNSKILASVFEIYDTLEPEIGTHLLMSLATLTFPGKFEIYKKFFKRAGLKREELQAALYGLGRIGTSESINLIIDLGNRVQEQELKETFVYGLALVKDPSELQKIIDGLVDPEMKGKVLTLMKIYKKVQDDK